MAAKDNAQAAGLGNPLVPSVGETRLATGIDRLPGAAHLEYVTRVRHVKHRAQDAEASLTDGTTAATGGGVGRNAGSSGAEGPQYYSVELFQRGALLTTVDRRFSDFERLRRELGATTGTTWA